MECSGALCLELQDTAATAGPVVSFEARYGLLCHVSQVVVFQDSLTPLGKQLVRERCEEHCIERIHLPQDRIAPFWERQCMVVSVHDVAFERMDWFQGEPDMINEGCIQNQHPL
ncbi:hypothetical protein COCSUDRAFT_57237 [Coccomyxa subellipsoidea C-169]|uniref:Uncharacterized protein n=1 Tax=Coccomyxa subellipsoidea (strain C-169) TaxID=574566 RepID=I0YQK1_COCSC|nr:hypothetical protein COCSUDRAFT_57237 [Coccomyxa subellipsoidea C-169]EIE20670.1 hypothetical protein COCSUDRAFT_57237 [Coccomyxa subellipsoidea C-169]|eukprot:XP_005645214.1 hypothetical protein COCSUDRAFT_57237 [Coccomyxa subellipsoidea C-169]